MYSRFANISELLELGTDSITIPPGSTAELLLLFTFNESDSMYVVTQSEEFLQTKHIISIPFTQLNRYKFLIKFYGQEYSHSEEETFRLEGQSWNDDIGLIKT